MYIIVPSSWLCGPPPLPRTRAFCRATWSGAPETKMWESTIKYIGLNTCRPVCKKIGEINNNTHTRKVYKFKYINTDK